MFWRLQGDFPFLIRITVLFAYDARNHGAGFEVALGPIAPLRRSSSVATLSTPTQKWMVSLQRVAAMSKHGRVSELSRELEIKVPVSTSASDPNALM